MLIKSNFEINFLEGFKHLVHLLKNSKLKHLIDLEILWYKEVAHLIRKEETLKDLTQNQILIDFNETATVN